MSRLRSWYGSRGPLGAQGRRVREEVIEVTGGRQRARVIALLAAVLALSSADTSAVGAAAGPLEHAMHIDFTEIGLLVAVPSLASALSTVPIGALTDRVRRVSLLSGSIALWSLAMIAAGASTSFGMLLISRLAIGAVTATSGPTLASLTGDFFEPRERGRIYGFILTGDLIGSVLGLFVSGNVAALSWRLAFWVLVIPSAVLAWVIWRHLPEPARGGADRLQPRRGAGAAEVERAQEAERAREGNPVAEAHPQDDVDQAREVDPMADVDPTQGVEPEADPAPEVEEAVEEAGVRPRPQTVIGAGSARMSLPAAVRYVLSVPTNLALIIASALGYFFISGVLTFGVVFIRHQYSVGQSAATSLLALIAIAALVGVLVSGRLADRLLARGRVAARVVVAGGAFLVACVLFLAPLLSRSLLIGAPLLWLAGAALYGSNPPLDAARLDIMPHWLWGRAEGVRTLLRSLTTAAAPLLFGFISDQLGSGTSTHASGQNINAGGVSWAFLIMLIPLAAAGLIMLLLARRDYPRDVATAIASEEAAAGVTPARSPKRS